MNESDKQAFLIKMKEMANAVDRKIEIDQVDSFFKLLKSYPINIVCTAMDKALEGRDGDNKYLTRAMLTIPEIRREAAVLVSGKSKELKVGCEKCNHTGFMLTDGPYGQPIAERCECFLAVIKAQ